MHFRCLTSVCNLSGEANVYTLGDLGAHRVVTTKLPMTNFGMDSHIATGSTTTRLLGTFQVNKIFITFMLKTHLVF